MHQVCKTNVTWKGPPISQYRMLWCARLCSLVHGCDVIRTTVHTRRVDSSVQFVHLKERIPIVLVWRFCRTQAASNVIMNLANALPHVSLHLEITLYFTFTEETKQCFLLQIEIDQCPTNGACDDSWPPRFRCR